MLESSCKDCKKHLIQLVDVKCSFGSRPHVFRLAYQRAWVCAITIGGYEFVTKDGIHMRKSPVLL
jgi:hypothetical protein